MLKLSFLQLVAMAVLSTTANLLLQIKDEVNDIMEWFLAAETHHIPALEHTDESVAPKIALVSPKPEDEKPVGFEIQDVTDGGCHSAPLNTAKILGTKTPYSSEGTNKLVTPSGCSARQIWMLNRHGTRNPSQHQITQMKTTLIKLRDRILKQSATGKLCKEVLDGLKNWEISLNTSDAYRLVKRGYLELDGISRRYQSSFPELFPKKFTNESYFFRTTSFQRTKESAKSFAAAIFGVDALPGVYFQKPSKNDSLLHFFKICPKWIQQVKNNPKVKFEVNQFKESEVFQNMVKRVKQRLNLGDDHVSTRHVLIMYDACAFETAWNTPVLSSWCAVFDEEDLRILEYLQDLHRYWQDGYAVPINYEQACEPIRDLVERFSSKANNPENPLVTTAYFSHDETLMKVYSRLGLFRDPVNLTAKGYENFKTNRQWMTSKIAKFASNLAFILFECPAEVNKYKIGSFVQESPVDVDACDGHWLCPLSQFVENLNFIVDTCNLGKICKI